MSTSSVEDRNFGATFLEDIIAWISSEFDPEDIFTEAQLEKWAEDNDWIKGGVMFLQIGAKAIAIEHITSVFLGDEQVTICLDILDGDCAEEITFKDDDYKAFMHWWKHKADVYKALL